MLLLASLAAAWQAPRFVAWDRYRPAIAAAASARLGRPVEVAGPISLALLPQPVLVASAVTAPDSGDGFAAEVADLRLQLALGPLLAGRLDVAALSLRGVRLHLPWPPAWFASGPLALRLPPGVAGMRAEIADAVVLVGGVSVEAVDGRIAVDKASGAVTLAGQGTAFGRRWRGTAQWGQPGGDGSTPVEASLDEATGNLGGKLSGQLAADGSVTGQVRGQGRDLSQLMAGPAAPWQAAGQFRAADGLALAEDLDLDIGDAPAHGAVALRLLPAARLDMALSSSRLDLDAWLSRLAAGRRALPTGLDLTAEAATLAGGTLRRLHAALDVTPDAVSLNTLEAVLPGDAALSLSGRFADGRFVGTGRLAAPALRDTLRWLQPYVPALAAALPPGVLQTAALDAGIRAGDGQVVLDPLAGTVDEAAVSGALGVLGGARPAFNATLAIDGLLLDPWLPAPPAGLPGLAAALAAWPGRWDGFDGALMLDAKRPRLHGVAMEAAALDGTLQAGTLTVRRAAAAGLGFAVALRGAVAPGGHVTNGVLDASVKDAATLTPDLPGWLPHLLQPGLLQAEAVQAGLGQSGPPQSGFGQFGSPQSRTAQPGPPQTGLLHGPGTLHASVAGGPARLGVSAQGALGDLAVEATGTADMARPAWDGTVALRHPGAPRLLAALGLPGVASWLGDGSLALSGALAVDPGQAALEGLSVSAGQMRATGELHLGRGATPSLTGRLDAETLPIPLPALRSPEPLALDALAGWQAQVGISAAHVWLGPERTLENVSAALSLGGGALRITGLSGTLAGGTLTGQAALDTTGTPRLAADGALTGATLADPQAFLTGGLDAAASLSASGYSPGALLATLDGTAHMTVTGGALAGVDLPAAGAALALPDPAAVQAAMVRALAGGQTPFARLNADAAVHGGTVELHEAALAAPSGRMALSGTLDLPIDAADLHIALTPALPGAPTVGLRLIGPAAAPRRTPELAGLAGWLAGR